MNIAASSPGSNGFLSRRFWMASFAAVAALHFGAGATAMFWRPSGPAPAEPAAAIMVELAPAPSASPEPVSEIPPGPEQVEAPPQPEPEPEPEPLPEIEPDPPVVEKAEIALPPAPEPEPPEEPVEEEKEEVEQTTAPAEGAPSLSQSRQAVSWQSALLGRLERFKRYPSEAQRARREGVVYVRFTMDREGKVLSKRIEQSSGSSALNREALDLLDRAQPLPPPPPDVEGEVIELVVPVEFFLKR